MPRYLIERSIPRHMPRADLDAAIRQNAMRADMPEVRWIRSYVSDAEGKMYCEFDAPTLEAMLEHARRAGVPIDRLTEISLEIDPAMFA